MAGRDYGDIVITIRSGPQAGRTLQAMGEARLKPSGYNITGEVSADHQTHNRSFAPQPVSVAVDFDRGDIDWDILEGVRFDMTWHEVHAGWVHHMTQAALVGDASDSMRDGKSTGREVQCTKRNYRKTAA